MYKRIKISRNDIMSLNNILITCNGDCYLPNISTLSISGTEIRIDSFKKFFISLSSIRYKENVRYNIDTELVTTSKSMFI